MAEVAFLGTGLLGSGMIERMLQQGQDVIVWNRSAHKTVALQELGAKVAATPEAAVGGASFVHMVLADDAVVDGVLEPCRPASRRECDRHRSQYDLAGRHESAVLARGRSWSQLPARTCLHDATDVS